MHTREQDSLTLATLVLSLTSKAPIPRTVLYCVWPLSTHTPEAMHPGQDCEKHGVPDEWGEGALWGIPAVGPNVSSSPPCQAQQATGGKAAKSATLLSSRL